MILHDSDREALRGTAGRMADAARKISLSFFRQPGLQAENKAASGYDPVTEADRACELAMREILDHERPDDAILGEEHGTKDGTTGLRWVLDPIDGTRGFVSGTPTWGVLIALCDANGPVFGLIDQPFTGERFEGGFGVASLTRGAQVTPLVTRTTTALKQATLFSTFPEVGTTEDAAKFSRVSEQVKLTRFGMDCYAYALLALGQIDLVIEAGLQSYDILAPIAVIEAAGGIVTDWQGQPAHEGGRVLAAGNAVLHAAALEVLAAPPEA